MKAKLEPVDLKRCQAEKPSGHNFMTWGPRQKYIRCGDKAVVVATEVKKGSDGQIGSMSLCSHCFEVMQKQMPFAAHFKFIWRGK